MTGMLGRLAMLACLFVFAHSARAVTPSLDFTLNDPTVTVGDIFGRAVAIDANYVLIGAPWDDTNALNSGQVHLFNAATGALLQTFNAPEVSVYQYFGISVAIDGNNILIGSSVRAHLFDATSGNLVHTFIDPTPTIGDYFGRSSVAIDGNHVLIGAAI